MKTPREKFGYAFIILIFIALFLIHLKCVSQTTERYYRMNLDTREVFVTKQPLFGLKFRTTEDTSKKVFVNIYADSVSFKYDRVMFFVYYNYDIDLSNSKLKIGLEDGRIIVFFSNYSRSGYAEYFLDKKTIEILKNNKFDYIASDDNNGGWQCVNIKTKDKYFFSDFLNEL